MANPVAEALREVVCALRNQGGFNDKSVDHAFRSMADQLEKRADYLDPPPEPVVEAVEAPAPKDDDTDKSPKKETKKTKE
jgi:hypothetical protein